MRNRWLARLLCAFALATVPLASTAGPLGGSPMAPAFTHARPADWLNSPPLDWARLRGKVVLVEFWTFACINCIRSLPWLKSVYAREAPNGLEIVAVHTPELPQERDRDKLVSRVRHYGLRYPVMIDTDHSYWRAMHNRYWPAYYLVDKHGLLRGSFAGEVHVGDPHARAIESLLQALLAEG